MIFSNFGEQKFRKQSFHLRKKQHLLFGKSDTKHQRQRKYGKYKGGNDNGDFRSYPPSGQRFPAAIDDL